MFNINTKWIAHRGLSSKYYENTIKAFKYAAKLPFYGIETDIHITKNDKIITHHDDYLLIDNKKIFIKDYVYKLLNKLFKNKHYEKLPTLKDYLLICKKYKKVPVIEIKPLLKQSQIILILKEIIKYFEINKVIIISFHLKNLIYIYEFNKDIKCQFLINDADDPNIEIALKYNFDFDVYIKALNKYLSDKLKKSNRLINCWTLNNFDLVEKAISLGADFITTDGF